MFLTLLLGLIFIGLIWLGVRWKIVKEYWRKRGVPHSPPHPIFGSLTSLQKENPTQWMRRLYKDFKKPPYIGIWLFWRPALIINSPELAKKILVKDFDVFRNRFLSAGSNDPFGSLNIFTVDDPLWSKLRRQLTSVFTSSKLRVQQAIAIQKVNDLIERIRKDGEKEHVDLRIVFQDFTTDVTGEFAFGVKSESTKNGESLMRKATLDMMRYSTYRGICWSAIFFFPSLVDIFGFTFYPKHTTDYMRECFRAIVKQRGGYDKQVTECKDLMDTLIMMKQKFDAEGQEMSEDLVLAQAAILLFGGFDTSANALTWLTYELAHNTQCQEKLYQELLDAKKSLDGRDFEGSFLAELPYLNAVIKETLRKYAPMGWLDRIASQDYKLDDQLTISAGTPVYVNATKK